MDSTATRGFRKLCFATLVAVYIVILAGGIVRTSGSGMGCPDWPKCFGSWAPPTSADKLPTDYKSIYALAREKKNVKFAKFLRNVGFKDTADQILADQSIHTEADFDVTKAWIEYGNRLIGVVVGFLVVALFWRAAKVRRRDPHIYYLSLATLVVLMFQGWFGSIVVSTNLTTWTVTVHMFLALLIVAFVIRLLGWSTPEFSAPEAPSARWLLIACMTSLLIQTLLGTNVRSAIDMVANQLPRSEWVDTLGISFIIHRSFSIIVVVLHVSLLLKLGKTMGSKALPRALIVIILGALLTGVGMAWWSVPAVLQPLHLLLATSAFGIQLYLFFQWAPGQKSYSNQLI